MPKTLRTLLLTNILLLHCDEKLGVGLGTRLGPTSVNLVYHM